MSPRHLVSVFVSGFLGLGLLHCGGETKVECDPAKCAAGNQCIEQDGVTECRLTCDAQTGPTGCPYGYRCATGATATYCQALTYKTTEAPGQWGTPCNSLEGAEASACDKAQGFYCQFSDRNDPNAFCSLYGCQSDSECAGGYYCGDANVIPSAPRAKRTIGETERYCLPRTYCAPCEHDVDCGPADDGQKQRCAADANGKGFCTKPCTKDTNCADEAKCVDYDDTKVCYPIAQVCVGDGNFCSPCRSDADCTAGGGACVKSRYSTEKTCTVASKVKCENVGSQTKPPVFDCPATTPEGAAANSIVSCVGAIYKEVPADQCSGLVRFGRREEDGYQVGCYARPR